MFQRKPGKRDRKANPGALGLGEVKEGREMTEVESRLHIYQLVKDLNFTFMPDLL